jgi:hypothetical protein
VYGYADDWLAEGPGWVTFDEPFRDLFDEA